jgi:hypothetical protein
LASARAPEVTESVQEVGAGIKRALDEGICTRQQLFVTTKVHNLSFSFDVAIVTISCSCGTPTMRAST